MTKQTDEVESVVTMSANGSIERKFHSSTDPLDDVQIGVASKKKFIEWWKAHTQYPIGIRNVKGVVDSGKVVRLGTDGSFNIYSSPMIIMDDYFEEFPYKMNMVENFTFEIPELHSLKNCPKECRIGQFGTHHKRMKYMDTLVGTPTKAQSLTIHTESVFLSLENSLTSDIDDLTINAPSFASFDGLTNVNVGCLTLIARHQKSFKGIHRSIKSNVKALSISIHDNFDISCGVLPFAMLDPSIVVISHVSDSPPSGFVDAMEVVSESREVGMNAHDIQELLIDKGLGKYARL